MQARFAHRIISGIFFILLVIFFLYFLFFSPGEAYPLSCAVKAATGEYCTTCGMSRAFSHILQLEWKTALELNQYALFIFAFFMIQLLMRGGIVLFYQLSKKHRKGIISMDIFISSIIFLVCFSKLIFANLETLFR